MGDVDGDEQISYEEFLYFLWHGRVPLRLETMLQSLPPAEREKVPPLIKAIGAADLEAVKKLVEGGADPNVKHEHGEDLAPALVLCCMQIRSDNDSKIPIVQYLVSKSEVNVNARSSEGLTAMNHCAAIGISSLVKALLARDDLDLKTSGLRGHPMLSAARCPMRQKGLEVTKLLLTHPALAKTKFDFNTSTGNNSVDPSENEMRRRRGGRGGQITEGSEISADERFWLECLDGTMKNERWEYMKVYRNWLRE